MVEVDGHFVTVILTILLVIIPSYSFRAGCCVLLLLRKVTLFGFLHSTPHLVSPDALDKSISNSGADM